MAPSATTVVIEPSQVSLPVEPTAYPGDLSEEELLLRCARRDLRAEDRARIEQILAAGINGERLLSLARRHGLVPLLWAHLGAHLHTQGHAPWCRKLEAAAKQNARLVLRLTGELLGILDSLERQGIEAVAYKGPCLALQVYGNIGLRQAGDLDILVHERDVAGARALLMARGYRRRFQLSSAQEAGLLRSGHADVFDRGDGTIVELHWRLTKRVFPFPIDLDRLWLRLETLVIGGRPIAAFSREDLLLILCVHGTKHVWKRLEWLVGVAELIRGAPDLDWSLVVLHAEELECRRILLLGLYLASAILGVPLPSHVQALIRRDRHIERLGEQVRRRLFSDHNDEPELVTFHFRTRERIRTKLQLAFRSITTLAPEDWASVALNDSLYPLYYVLRPLRLLGVFFGRMPRIRIRVNAEL